MRPLALLLAAGLLAGPAVAQDAPVMAAPVLTDPELAQLTGKFLLPGGVEVALTVTSDTVLNGQPVLRTVFAVDRTSSLAVYGRDPAGFSGGASPDVSTTRATNATSPTGITIAMDRHSGLQTITTTYVASQPGVTLGGPVADASTAGLERLVVTPDGPAVRTPDGLVNVRTLANGTLVSLTGDQLQASHLAGQSIATALVNSGNDRVFDTVTNVAIDLRNVAPYQIGAAAIRADTLALDATRSMIR